MNIVIDRSGSMVENGKPRLILNLVRFIRQHLSSSEVQIYTLQDQLNQVHVDPALDIELPEITGPTNIDRCIEFLIERTTEPTVFLSDGFFDLTESQKRILKQQHNLVVVAVGADADFNNLNFLGLPVYPAQDIGVAIKHANGLNTQRTLPPLQRSDVQLSEPVRGTFHDQGEDDDWD